MIRNGRVIDGTGAPEFVGDVAVDAATITSVGNGAGTGRREIDAEGKLVVPGRMDIRTHFDAWVSWDPYLTPWCWNGVTTIVLPPVLRSALPGLRAGERQALHATPQGHDATICAGEIVLWNDEFTGALPGRLVRRGR